MNLLSCNMQRHYFHWPCSLYTSLNIDTKKNCKNPFIFSCFFFPLSSCFLSPWKSHYFPWRNSPPVGQDLLIIEASRSHSVGLPWTSDQPDAETSTWQETDIHFLPPVDSNAHSQPPSGHRPTPLDRVAAVMGCYMALVCWVMEILKMCRRSSLSDEERGFNLVTENLYFD